MPNALTLKWDHQHGYTAHVATGPHGWARLPTSSPPRESLSEHIAGRDVLVVTTPTAWRLHGLPWLPGLFEALDVRSEVFVMPLNESTKSMASVENVCRRAQSLGRRGMIIAVGGGVCSDVVTVAASLHRRGIDYLCLPTTLLAQVDAGIGIKGAVNFDGHKNRLGTFHPPLAVFADAAWLGTLPPVSLIGGMGEIVKLAVMRDPVLFELLERWGAQVIDSAFQQPPRVAVEILHRSVAGMLAELALDPFESSGRPRLMDFGHTYSPLLEQASGYRMGHGHAVSVDLAIMAELAVRLGHLARVTGDRILALLTRLGLPITTPWCEVSVVRASITEAQAHRNGRLRMPLPARVGEAVFVDDPSAVTDEVIADCLGALRSRRPVMGRRKARPSEVVH